MPNNKSSESERQTPLQLLKRIDWTGSFLLAGWLGAALVAVSLVTNSTEENAYHWADPPIIGLLVLALVLFIVFLFVELKFASEPVMPFELLRSSTSIAVAINNFLISLVIFGSVSISSDM
jgi:hypothetical protein